MNLSEATAIVESLADGIDPVSGEPLPQPGPYHHPQVIRALFSVLSHVRQTQEVALAGAGNDHSTGAARNLHERLGKPWTPKEDEELIAEFHAAVEFRDIAKRHGRSRGAIISRLTKLGEMQPRYDDSDGEVESNWDKIKKQRTQAGKVWTSEQDDELIRHYDARVPLEEIAERLGRGVRGVEVRLAKLGRLEVDSPAAECDS